MAGCGDGDGGSGAPIDTETDDAGGDADADAGGDAGSDSDSDTDGDTDTDAFDCSAVPSAPLLIEQVDSAIAFHDVAFDNEGFLVGHDGYSSLFKTASNGSSGVFVPGFSWINGMDYLPGGDLIAATQNEGLSRITSLGTHWSIAPSLSGLYGVTVGPDGMVYAADDNSVYRVDPDTGDVETLIPSLSARVVEFTPDLTQMYIGAVGMGMIYVADLDDEFNLVGSPTVFVTLTDCSDMGGLGVDICGNLYVECHEFAELRRITPDGTVSVYHDWLDNEYGHGLEWGSGIAGWDDRSLYLPQPYNGNTVVRVQIGVPYRE